MIETIDQLKAIITQPGFDPYSAAGQEALAQVKRPSPAFEYVMQLQAQQAQQTPGEAYGWQNQADPNAQAMATAAQNYGQLNAQSDAYEKEQSERTKGWYGGADTLDFLKAAAATIGGVYGAGQLAGGMGGLDISGGLDGLPAGADLGADAAWGVNARPEFSMGADPWGVGAADPGLSVGNLNVPNYGGSLMDQFPGAAATGNAGWDAALGGANVAASGGNWWDGLLNGAGSAAGGLGNAIGGMKSGQLLGAGLGALAGSLNGQKQAGTTTTTTDVPEWLKPYYLDLISKGQAQTNQAPADYSQSDAVLKGAMGMTNPYLNQQNPYFEKTLGLALDDTQGRVNNQFRNSAFGGSANQELLSRNLGDQANSMRFGQYKNAQDLYGTEMNRAQNVASGMPQYQAQKSTSGFQPLLNQKSLLSTGGSQSSSPYYTNPTGSALYGGLLGSQLFGGK